MPQYTNVLPSSCPCNFSDCTPATPIYCIKIILSGPHFTGTAISPFQVVEFDYPISRADFLFDYIVRHAANNTPFEASQLGYWIRFYHTYPHWVSHVYIFVPNVPTNISIQFTPAFMFLLCIDYILIAVYS